LEVLPVAAPPPKRQLSDLELKNLRAMEENILRELRLFLRQIVWKLMADRKFKEFLKPVDLEEVPDYFEVIKEPMDLSTIMTKINSHKYVACKQFLKDVDLITNNCLEYNPDRDTYDRLLRNRACELRDTAHAMIYADLDPEFEKMCEEINESRQKRNECEEIFAPSYIRVLQKNTFPMRASAASATCESAAPKSSAIDVASELNPVQPSSHKKLPSTPERPTRQSRRLRGEESLEIPSFSTPLEKIIRSADGRRRRDDVDTTDCRDGGEEVKNRSLSSGIKAVNGVHESNESLEEQQPVVKEEKDTALDRKPDPRDSFSLLHRSEKEVEVIDLSDETSTVDDKALDDSPNGREATSPQAFPTCLLLSDGTQSDSSEVQSTEQSGNKAKPQESTDDNRIQGMEESSGMVCNRLDKIEVDSVLCEADEHINKEAFQSLLAKLVIATKSDTISSLEKTYFSVSNLIHRHRKNADKVILIEELDKFISKLADVR